MAIPSHPLKCPKCSSESVRRCRKTLLDRILLGFGLTPVRCRECRTRFRTHREKTPSQAAIGGKRKESTKRRRDARKREFFVYGCALVTFVFMLYAITRERG